MGENEVGVRPESVHLDSGATPLILGKSMVEKLGLVDSITLKPGPNVLIAGGRHVRTQETREPVWITLGVGGEWECKVPRHAFMV